MRLRHSPQANTARRRLTPAPLEAAQGATQRRTDEPSLPDLHAGPAFRPVPLAAVVGALSLLAGCQDETFESPTPQPVTTVQHPIQESGTIASVSLDQSLTVRAIQSGDGDLYLGTTSGLYRLEDSLESPQVSPVEYLPQTGDPSDTGAIQAITRRSYGLLVAADNGLFYTYGQVLIYSPLSAAFEGQTIRDISVSIIESSEQAPSGSAQTEEVVWVATDQGLFRADESGIEQILLPINTKAAQALLSLPSLGSGPDGLLLVSFETGVYELDGASWHPVALGDSISHFAARDESVYGLSSAGLVERTSAGEWRLHTLQSGETVSGEGAEASTLLSFGFDPEGLPLLGTSQGVLRLEGLDDDQPAALLFSSTSGTGIQALNADVFGNIWFSTGTSLEGLMLGSPLSFAERVAPIFSQRCNSCHLEGAAAPAHDFTRWEEVEPMLETILQRIYTGQMPSTGPLPVEESDVIVQWDESGRNP